MLPVVNIMAFALVKPAKPSLRERYKVKLNTLALLPKNVKSIRDGGKLVRLADSKNVSIWECSKRVSDLIGLGADGKSINVA